MKQPKILEQFVLSKLGDMESCEDHIHIGDDFIAVFDGVTSKAENLPYGLKPGGIIASEISKGLLRLEPKASCSEALALLTLGRSEPDGASWHNDSSRYNCGAEKCCWSLIVASFFF